MNSRARNVNLTRVTEWTEGQVHTKDDFLAAEEPLEIRIGDEPLSVTMRTPGDDRELAAGFLFTEGFVTERTQIASIDAITSGPEGRRGNLMSAVLEPGVAFDLQRMRRNFFAASSCGICGKASIDSVRAHTLVPPNPDLRIGSAVLLRLPASLRSSQDVFERTGGLHAAALFDTSGQLLCLREDIGRHNAVDKVVGWALLNGQVPLRNSVLLVSGRGGFEIVQKATVAGLPVVACVSAPSSLAVQLAREMRLTLAGFLRENRFVIYSAGERIT